jgi:hypothetical protein
MEGELWIYPGEAASWHFLTLPKKEGIKIRAKFTAKRRGFGSLPVEATIGQTTWRTSIFPDKYSGSYILPVKASVRKAEDIVAGERVKFSVVVALVESDT